MLPAFATPTNPLSGYVASPTSDHYGGGGGGSQGSGPTPINFVDGGTGGGGGGYNRYGPVPGNGPAKAGVNGLGGCLLYTSPSPRDRQKSRMPSSA